MAFEAIYSLGHEWRRKGPPPCPCGSSSVRRARKRGRYPPATDSSRPRGSSLGIGHSASNLPRRAAPGLSVCACDAGWGISRGLFDGRRCRLGFFRLLASRATGRACFSFTSAARRTACCSTHGRSARVPHPRRMNSVRIGGHSEGRAIAHLDDHGGATAPLSLTHGVNERRALRCKDPPDVSTALLQPPAAGRRAIHAQHDARFDGFTAANWRKVVVRSCRFVRAR
jgi:hypothetical protein